jgi:hypothetical protein
MTFRNLTPLPCQFITAKTPEGPERDVVIIRATLDLVPAGAEARAKGHTHALKLAQEQRPLVVTDVHAGDLARSSMLWESDLAPVKPRCDVVVLGQAYAPAGRLRRRFTVGLRLRAPDQERPLPELTGPLAPGMEAEEECRWLRQVQWAHAHPIPGETILDKRLQVTGPRWLERRALPFRALGWLVRAATFGLVGPCSWKLTSPRPVASVPLRYELSFGGWLQVRPGDPGFRRVPRRHWRPGAEPKALARAAAQGQAPGVLAEAWWDANPVGCGYVPHWLGQAARLKRLPAPRIEDPLHPFTARAFLAASRGQARLPASLGLQGMGPVTRRWASRLQYAGTWYEGWNESGKPYFPGFQDAFWNVAPPDLQCRHLEGEEVLELTNLCPPGTSGLDRDGAGNAVLRVALPGLYPYLLMGSESGRLSYVTAVLDTLVVEPEEARVTLVFRASYPDRPQPLGVELGLVLAGQDDCFGAVPAVEDEPAASPVETGHAR